jgi:hypothetical protein
MATLTFRPLGPARTATVAGLLVLDEPLRLAVSWLRGIGVVLALVAGVVAMREGASSGDGHRTR